MQEYNKITFLNKGTEFKLAGMLFYEMKFKKWFQGETISCSLFYMKCEILNDSFFSNLKIKKKNWLQLNIKNRTTIRLDSSFEIFNYKTENILGTGKGTF